MTVSLADLRNQRMGGPACARPGPLKAGGLALTPGQRRRRRRLDQIRLNSATQRRCTSAGATWAPLLDTPAHAVGAERDRAEIRGRAGSLPNMSSTVRPKNRAILNARGS